MSKRIAYVVAAFLLVLTSALAGAAGTTYYVDSVGGDDGKGGTSASAAWKTPAKVSSMTFGPGDTVCFKRDCQFTGALVLHGSGTSANPIAIDAYGRGNKPVLIGDATSDSAGTVRLVVRFPAADARYVKLYAKRLRQDASGNHGIALAEIEVYGK